MELAVGGLKLGVKPLEAEGVPLVEVVPVEQAAGRFQVAWVMPGGVEVADVIADTPPVMPSSLTWAVAGRSGEEEQEEGPGAVHPFRNG